MGKVATQLEEVTSAGLSMGNMEPGISETPLLGYLLKKNKVFTLVHSNKTLVFNERTGVFVF